jgi:hypothetical protein
MVCGNTLTTVFVLELSYKLLMNRYVNIYKMKIKYNTFRKGGVGKDGGGVSKKNNILDI